MKLVVTIDTVNTNKMKFQSQNEIIKNDISTLSSISFDCKDSAVRAKLEELRENIKNKMNELIEATDSYYDKINQCMLKYTENEENIKVIDLANIKEVIKHNPDVTRKYKSSTVASKITSFSSLEIPLVCQFETYDYNGKTLCRPFGDASLIVTDGFGYRPSENTNGIGSTNHQGIDLCVEGGTSGAELVSAIDGEVIRAEYYGGYGNCIEVYDASTDTTVLYGHLSEIGVNVGDQVSMGDYIGNAGSTGNSTGPHLHFEVQECGTPVDPAPYLGL